MKFNRRMPQSIKRKTKHLKKLMYEKIKSAYFFIVPRSIRFIAGKVDPNLILLDSPYYRDNVKVLAEYIAENKPQYRIICFIDKEQPVKKCEKIKFIRRAYQAGDKNAYSLAAYYYALKAKYVFYTHSFKWAGDKNKDQVIVNLWHGSGYKGGEPATVAHNFDFMMVPGEIFIRSKAEFFDCEESKILTLGYPRYDLFHAKDNTVPNTFFKKLNIDLAIEKVVIWLPTFVPDNYLLIYEDPIPYFYSGIPLIESLDQAIELDEFCQSNNIRILLKKHNLRYSTVPLDKYLMKLKNITILSDEAFNVYNIELYDLLPFTDGLISDFSSVAVDYLLLNKPLAYILKDIEGYRKTRGFVFEDPLAYMPGDHVYTFEDLKSFILNVSKGEDKYQKLRADKMPMMHNTTDSYSKRILDYFNL